MKKKNIWDNLLYHDLCIFNAYHMHIIYRIQEVKGLYVLLLSMAIYCLAK